MLLTKRHLTVIVVISDEIRLERLKRPIAQRVGFNKREPEVSELIPRMTLITRSKGMSFGDSVQRL